MKARVLQPFGYSPDGIRVLPLVAGDVAEIRDALVPGLTEAGYIAAPEASAETTEPAAAPADPGDRDPELDPPPAPEAEKKGKKNKAPK